MKPSTGAAVRDHRNAVRDRSESLSAFNRNRCPQSSESAQILQKVLEKGYTTQDIEAIAEEAALAAGMTR
jgi:hypothetical protein